MEEKEEKPSYVNEGKKQQKGWFPNFQKEIHYLTSVTLMITTKVITI